MVFNDRGDTFHKITRLFGFLSYLGGRKTEIVENQGRFPPKSGNDRIDHIVKRLTGLLSLELRESKILAKVFEWNTKIFRLDSSFHQLDIGYRSLSSFSQTLEIPGTIYLLKSMSDTVGRFCQFDTFGNCVGNITGNFMKPRSEKLAEFCHDIAGHNAE